MHSTIAWCEYCKPAFKMIKNKVSLLGCTTPNIGFLVLGGDNLTFLTDMSDE